MIHVNDVAKFTGLDTKFIITQYEQYNNYDLIYLPSFIFAHMSDYASLVKVFEHATYKNHSDIIPLLIKNKKLDIVRKLINDGMLQLTENSIICVIYCGKSREIEWLIKKHIECVGPLSHIVIDHVIKQMDVPTFVMAKKYMQFNPNSIICAFRYQNHYVINYLISDESYEKTTQQLANILLGDIGENNFPYKNIQIRSICNAIITKTHKIHETMIYKNDIDGLIYFMSIGFSLSVNLVYVAIYNGSYDIFFWLLKHYKLYMFPPYFYAIAAANAYPELISEMFKHPNIIWDESAIFDLCKNTSKTENVKHILNHFYDDKPIYKLLMASREHHNYELEFIFNNNLL